MEIRIKTMIRVSNVKMPLKHTLGDLKAKIAKNLKTKMANLKKLEITKKAIDARDKEKIVYVYSVDIEIENQEIYLQNKNVSLVQEFKGIEIKSGKKLKNRPIIVGSGPSGLFSALTLAKAGLNPIIIERGKDVDERKKDVYKFFETGELNTESNIQFGEGGAGTFSDGKLTTGTNDIRIRYVIEEFVSAGAPKEIAYLSKPHIGTDNLVLILKNLRQKIEKLGGEFRFQNQLVDFYCDDKTLNKVRIKTPEKEYELETDNLILAIGHSARDTFDMLNRNKVNIQSKSFAVGVRIEHKQKTINKSQYGKFAKNLGAADYKLATHLKDGRGVYTFCMCPGGVVVAAASEKEHLAINGMSHFARNAENSNSALLVSVSPNDFDTNDVLAGVHFQRMLEKKAYNISKDYKAPIQLVGDFLNNKTSSQLGSIQPSYKPGYVFCDMRDIFPEFIIEALKEGLLSMDKKLEGFAAHDAVLTGVETRSSSPIKIFRDSDYCCNIEGLFPCGEGAGYAGGIMSAAVDGIKCAESIINRIVD